MSKDPVLLEHILECIQRVQSKADKYGKDAFINDPDITDIILRNLQIMAESTQRLSLQIKMLAPQIPWQDISDFRNVLVHEYLGLELGIIWEVIEKELPDLQKAARKMLEHVKKETHD